MRLGEGEESWDRFVVESPVAVVGAVDTSSEDSEMADSSRLTPTMAGYIPSTRNGGVEGTDMCSDRENMFLELGPWGQQTDGDDIRCCRWWPSWSTRGRIILQTASSLALPYAFWHRWMQP